MKISDLQAWLEAQKALHSDIGIVCMTAVGSIAPGNVPSTELCGKMPGMLAFRAMALMKSESRSNRLRH